jgi:hypothetical protein
MGLVAAHGNQKVRTKISVIFKKVEVGRIFWWLNPRPQTQNYDPYD